MLRDRIKTLLILAPVGLVSIFVGGWLFTAFLAVMWGVAAWEFWRIFSRAGFTPSLFLLVGGVVAMLVIHTLFGFEGSQAVLAGVILAAMAFSLSQYERGRDFPASNFLITTGGVVYLGWLGIYLVSLRNMPDGLWWLALSVPACWWADMGAYFVGSRFGRHKMAPRLSPKKSWEGYIGGVPFALVLCGLIGYLIHGVIPAITLERGLLFGLVIAILAPLGDLGESMIKRQFSVKDSSNLLPGHGGFLDRIDSTLWAGVISYYLIVWFMR